MNNNNLNLLSNIDSVAKEIDNVSVNIFKEIQIVQDGFLRYWNPVEHNSEYEESRDIAIRRLFKFVDAFRDIDGEIEDLAVAVCKSSKAVSCGGFDELLDSNGSNLTTLALLDMILNNKQDFESYNGMNIMGDITFSISHKEKDFLLIRNLFEIELMITFKTVINEGNKVIIPFVRVQVNLLGKEELAIRKNTDGRFETPNYMSYRRNGNSYINTQTLEVLQ